MIPAKGGASPEAMLLVSMPTGFFSMKLLYMVQAEFKRKTQTHNKPMLHQAATVGSLVALHVKLLILCVSFTSFWFHAVDSGLITA